MENKLLLYFVCSFIRWLKNEMEILWECTANMWECNFLPIKRRKMFKLKQQPVGCKAAAEELLLLLKVGNT